MRKLLAALLVVFSLAPYVAMAAFPTQSANLVNASDQYFNRASFTDITGDLTVETWFKLTGTVGTANMLIAAKIDNAVAGGGGTIDWFWAALPTGGNTTWQFLVNDGGGLGSSDITVSGQTIWDGNWHHLAVVFTAASQTAEFFVDGVSVGTGVASGKTSIRSSTRYLWIGCQGTNCTVPFDPEGNITMMRIWSTTRTATDFSTNWCTYLGATTNLVAEYGFDGVATDNSGNGNDLTAVNSPTYEADIPTTCPAPSRLLFFHPF